MFLFICEWTLNPQAEMHIEDKARNKETKII